MNGAARVRLSRELTDATFPLPQPRHCVRFAMQECTGEYDDALIRIECPQYARNNDRNDDPRKEWGQGGYMILSAWIQVQPTNLMPTPDDGREYSAGQAYIDTTVNLAHTLEEPNLERGLYLYCALISWCEMCAAQGWDVDDLIEETCVSFERKHARVAA